MANFVWTGATDGNWTTGSNWKVGGVIQAAPPTAADLAQFGTGVGATNANCTTANTSVCQSLNVDDSYSGTITLVNANNALRIGDANGGYMHLGAACTITSAGTNTVVVLRATSDNSGSGWQVTWNGKGINRVQFNGTGGKWRFVDDFVSVSGGGATSLRVTAGTLDCNNMNVTFVGTSGGMTVDGGTVLMGTGTFTYNMTGAASFFSYTSGTITGGSETHVLAAASASTRTFTGGGQTYGTLTYTVAGSTGQLTVAGSNTFSGFNFSDATNARTVMFTSTLTTTFTNGALVNINGTSGKLMSIIANTAGTKHNFTISAGTINCNYLSVTDNAASVASYCGPNGSVSNTTNWFASSAPSGNMLLVF